MTLAVVHHRGTAGDLHGLALPEPAAPAVWVMDVVAPALALGSRQSLDDADAGACAAAGVEVVRRRSGGGAVLLLPGEVVWLDVVLPRGHARWTDDVHDAMVRVGEAWVAALGAQVPGDLAVHRGRLVRDAWSDLVCFAGLGPGEVLLGGRKLVGISQRRTRDAARFQCLVHRRVDLAATAALLRGTPHAALPDVAVAADVDADVLALALAAVLDR